MSAPPFLSRAGYLAGLQCERRLWLATHATSRAQPGSPSLEETLAGSRESARLARRLFPGGRAVTELPYEEAVQRTRSLLADAAVPAIFDAAFSHESVQIRVDVLERSGPRSWKLCTVKESGNVREDDLDETAFALFATRANGLAVTALEVIYVDESFVRQSGPIDWQAYFSRRDVTAEVEFLLDDVADQAERLTGVLESTELPMAEPSPHCRRPWSCEFRAHCLKRHPDDWIDLLPGLRSSDFHALREAGIERIAEIPASFPLREAQTRARNAHLDGRLALSASLPGALVTLGTASSYLDFEAIAPAVPIFAGTRPFQVIPFGWSLHRRATAGALDHLDFLATGRCDPRHEFAETLLAALAARDEPVVVYSPFEDRVLADLAIALPELAAPIERIRARLIDLQAIIRNDLYHVDFRGSLSLKRVAAALSPGFTYADLDQISEGGAAARALEQIARAELDEPEEIRTRNALRSYCARDTEALAVIHRALQKLVGESA